MRGIQVAGILNFNPRSREGSDYRLLYSGWRVLNFNPRSREGSDQSDSNTGITKDISIHAPVKGATRRWRCRPAGRRYFNPRSREGSDPASCPWVVPNP